MWYVAAVSSTRVLMFLVAGVPSDMSGAGGEDGEGGGLTCSRVGCCSCISTCIDVSGSRCGSATFNVLLAGPQLHPNTLRHTSCGWVGVVSGEGGEEGGVDV